MKKEDVLKTAVLFRTLYQTLKECTEGKDERYKGFKYIPLNISFAPSMEQIKGLSSYILENEDRRLYENTFGMIDVDFLNSVYWKLDEAQWGWDKDIKYNLSIGNKAEVRELSGDDFLYIVEVYDLWGEIGAILREARLLQPIFKNLIPHPDTSTPVITEMVIDTSTGATGTDPDWLSLLSDELITERAIKYFARAIERGFILPTSTGFKWIRKAKKGEGVNTLIALLGGMIYCGDEVIKSRYGDKWQLGDGGIFPDEELKQLFEVKSLGAIRTNELDSSRQKTAPRGWRDIVELFED